MRESLVAWAGDCRIEGTVELGVGRISDQLNDLATVTFREATLHSIADGHEVALPEVEVDKGELHAVIVDGHRGDPVRRMRTVQDRIHLEVGPFVVEGSIHRAPSTVPFAALSRWATFVPVTEARIGLLEGDAEPEPADVILVNRERIDKAESLASVPFSPDRAVAIPVEVDEPVAGVPAGVPSAAD